MAEWRSSAITRFLEIIQTRRGALRDALLALSIMAGLASAGDAEAGKASRRHRKRKQRRRRRRRNHRRKPCQGGLTRCDGVCVDTQTDPNNCGGCGDECDAGEHCRNGVCGCDVCDDEDACPFQTVQEAIDAADEGDTITVCKGSFAGTIDFRKSLTLIGAGADDTELKGTGGGTVDSVVTVPPNVIVAIQGVTITGGTGTEFDDGSMRGGGILNEGTLTVTDCVVEDNQANWGGGIFNLEQARLTISGTVVTQNKAIRLGAAGSLGGGIHNRPSGRMTIDNGSVISKNEADNGGGIYNIGEVTVRDSAISENTADFDGGGLTHDGGEITLSNVVVEDNTASEDGGGIFVVEGAVRLENGTAVRDNKAGGTGGGMFNNATMVCSQATIVGNKAGENGGGIFVGHGRIGPPSLTLEGTVISQNKAGDEGGGIFNIANGAINLDAQSRVVDNDPNNCVGTDACQP